MNKRKIDSEYSFDINMTEMLKGIGLMLMIFDHLFLNLEHTQALYETFFISKRIISIFATLCGVCVPIFLFLSGYGLSCSKKTKNDSVKVIL